MSTVLYKLSSCLTDTHFILMLLSIGNAYVSLSLSLLSNLPIHVSSPSLTRLISFNDDLR